MGTNFYINEKHIGKRSAAGPYCWDCKTTLCKEGEDKVHYDSEWFDHCPSCGNKKQEQSLNESAAGKELGFNKGPLNKQGVSSCCSFSWAMYPYQLQDGTIKDEYDRIYTKDEFNKMLEDCPIRYYSMIGAEFS